MDLPLRVVRFLRPGGFTLLNSDSDFAERPPLDAYREPPPDPDRFNTTPRETPLGEVGYAPSIVEDVERCWRCMHAPTVDKTLGLCNDCIDSLREANE